MTIFIGHIDVEQQRSDGRFRSLQKPWLRGPRSRRERRNRRGKRETAFGKGSHRAR